MIVFSFSSLAFSLFSLSCVDEENEGKSVRMTSLVVSISISISGFLHEDYIHSITGCIK
jgi:hypothetical protein